MWLSLLVLISIVLGGGLAVFFLFGRKPKLNPTPSDPCPVPPPSSSAIESPPLAPQRPSPLPTVDLSPNKSPAQLLQDSPRVSTPTRRGSGSSRVVSFPEIPDASSKALAPLQELADGGSAESAAFSHDGLLATAGANSLIHIYNHKVGAVGSIRHTLSVAEDTPRADAVSALGFCVDAGGRTNLLLVGTRTERYLLGYRLSKTPGVSPARVFAFATGHGGPLIGVAGFIGLETVKLDDHAKSAYLVTCSKGTREVKFWSFKGALLAVFEADCWTMGLKLDGKHAAVLACGGGPGSLLGVAQDKKGHIKLSKIASLPILVPARENELPTSPTVPGRLGKRPSLLMGDAVFQAAQDVLFYKGQAQTVVVRSTGSLSLGRIEDSEWVLDVDVPGAADDQVQFTHHVVLLEPGTPGQRLTRCVAARGKHALFYDGAGNVIARAEGAEGDVLQCVATAAGDLVVIVTFGGCVCRVFKTP